MNWKLEYLPEAEDDFKALDGSQRNLVLKAIKKVQQNPLPADENGYGKLLGNQNGKKPCWTAENQAARRWNTRRLSASAHGNGYAGDCHRRACG